MSISIETPWHRQPIPQNPSSELKSSWIRSLGEAEPQKFERRLAWDDQSDQIPWSTEEALSQANILQAIRKSLCEAADRPLIKQKYWTKNPDSQSQAFIDLWHPVAIWALMHLRTNFESQLSFPVASSAWEQLAENLLDRLCLVSEPTLWECFNRERGVGVLLLAQLSPHDDGSDEQKREYYKKFIQHHQQEGLSSLLSEYPVLGRLLSTVVALWLDSNREMLLRLDSDFENMGSIFLVPRNSGLSKIHQGISDPHQGGRTVSILTFKEGKNEKQVIYKPKDMQLDLAYQSILHDLNTHTSLPDLKTVTTLPRDGYGYMEFIPHILTANDEELSRFYWNAGRLTLLLYILGCTDCHHENLIAYGDQLVLIDTETLLQATIPNHVRRLPPLGFREEEQQRHHETSAPALIQSIKESVLRSGLLPTWMFVGKERIAVDMSALGIQPPPTVCQAHFGWLEINTDGMMAGYIQAKSKIPTSLPVGIGQANPLNDHLEVFIDGFHIQAQHLMQRRDDWLAEGGMLSHFENLPRRLLLRTTRVYFALQQEQIQPSALKNEQAQGLVLEQLACTYLLSDIKPVHWPIFSAEVRQMERLDIPFFVHSIDSNDLPLLPGMKPITGFLESNGLEACRKRLAKLNESEIAFQSKLIQGAVQARTLHPDIKPVQIEKIATVLNPTIENLSNHLNPKRRRETATQLARQLIDSSIQSKDGSIEWLGMDLGEDGEKFCFGPVGPSLYGGSSGIAVLLAILAREDKSDVDTCHNKILCGIFESITNLVARNDSRLLLRWWRDQSLGLSGTGGLILTLLELDRLKTGHPEGMNSYRDLALGLLSGLNEQRLLEDTRYDLLGGVAGMIGPLLRLGNSHANTLAMTAGGHLLTQQRETGGWSRPQVRAQSQQIPLTGFSHGTSGMLAALSRLYDHSGDYRFLEGARRAIEYERRSFDQSCGNWPDHRESFEGGTDFMVSWCHGAPGIALSRLCMHKSSLWDSALEEDLNIALEITAQSFLSSDHLCCGNMGLAAILRLCALHGFGERWKQISQDIEFKTVARTHTNGGQFSVCPTHAGSLVFPGFMTGLSGIGLTLLNTELSNSALSSLLTGGLLTP